MPLLDKALAPAKPPKIAGQDQTDFSTNQQATIVPWWVGRAPVPLTWIVAQPVSSRTEEIKQKVGKEKQTTGYNYFADVAGVAGLGAAVAVQAIESGDEVIWRGYVMRSENPAEAAYHSVTITTKLGLFTIYWGRADQPVPSMLAGKDHPAYRGQVVCCIKDYHCGQNPTVPNTRLHLVRAPQPPIGSWTVAHHQQGESIVAGLLELMTHPVHGAGMAPELFDAAQWQAVAAQVANKRGHFSPYLDKPQPIRDVAKDFASYYDGFFRIENGIVRPGFFPHDNADPGELASLGLHDYTQRPRIKTTAPGSTVNTVVVNYRDKDDDFADAQASESASESVEARDAHEPATVDMPHIIDTEQAMRVAAEHAALAADGTIVAEDGAIRAAKCFKPDGSPILPGDLVRTRLVSMDAEIVARVIRRVDAYGSEPEFIFEQEPGQWPTPAVPPPNQPVTLDAYDPDAIARARVVELTPELSGTPLGLPVAILAKRPVSSSESGNTSANVIGFSVWYSPTGTSYDWLGEQHNWAVRGVLALSAPAAAGGITLTLDADNIDQSRLQPLSDAAQADDTLLLIAGGEVMSVGNITISGDAWTFAALRGRRGTVAAALPAGAEAWLVFRDELHAYTHATFVAGQTRSFKLQPYSNKRAELADTAAISHTFRDRAGEAPVIVIGQVPDGAKVGSPVPITAEITDVNGDLATWRLLARQYAGATVIAEIAIAAGTAFPAEKAALTASGLITFPRAGDWRVEAGATDEAGAAVSAQSALFTVAANDSGSYGTPSNTPPPAPVAAGTGGLGQVLFAWTQPEPEQVSGWQASVHATQGETAEVTHDSLASAMLAIGGLPADTTRWCRVRAAGRNGLPSAWSAEVSATTLAVSAADLGGMGSKIIELQTALPDLARDVKGVLIAQGDAHAAVQVLSEGFLQPDGTLALRHAVRLDNNGWITGTELFNGGPGEDYFDVLASAFRVRHPGAPASVPFEVVDGEVRMKKAVIGKVTADMVEAESLSAISAVIGTLKSAAAPNARLEIITDQINVYDENNTLRVRLGRLTD